MRSLLTLLLATAVLAQDASEWTVGQVVSTSSGQIKGHASTWKPDVSEYLGIRYGAAPTGELRWAAPRAYESDEGYDAAEFSDSCVPNINRKQNGTISYENFQRTLLGVVGQVTDTFGEDCLTVNVWTKPQTGEKQKAVMVWIYGGGFGSGNSKSPMYNGARLADEYDVVVVSLNYRMNIWGFPHAPFLEDQNLGLLDQRLATLWVRDNIASFGGDPSRILLFGQSAGGGSTDLYSYAWTEDPVISAFIVESGAGADNMISTSGNQSAGWYETSAKAGCGGVEAGEATLACMRGKNWEEIMDVMEKRVVLPTPGAAAFTPIADGKVVFQDMSQRRREGKFIQAPILVGNNDNEGGFYIYLANMLNAPMPPSFSAIGNLTSGAGMGSGCGPHAVAAARANAGLPAWRYLYAGSFPNQDIGVPGAWHLAEIGIVFGTSEWMSHIADTPEEKELGETMRTAWTTFAKDPMNGLVEFGWPVYDPANEGPVIHLGGLNSSEVVMDSRVMYDTGCL